MTFHFRKEPESAFNAVDENGINITWPKESYDKHVKYRSEIKGWGGWMNRTLKSPCKRKVTKNNLFRKIVCYYSKKDTNMGYKDDSRLLIFVYYSKFFKCGHIRSARIGSINE